MKNLIRIGFSTSLLAGLMLSAGAAHAGPRIRYGALLWNTQPSGTIRESGSGSASSFDLRHDLGLSSQANGAFYFRWQPDSAVAPGVDYGYGQVSSDGHNTLTRTFTWHGTSYQANTKVASAATIKQMHVGALWRPVSTAAGSLSTGLELRWVSVNVSALDQSSGNQGSGGGNALVPMLDAGFRIGPPAIVALRARAAYIAYAGNRFLDYRAELSHRFGVGLVTALGYRREQIRITGSGSSLGGDVEAAGLYLRIGYAL